MANVCLVVFNFKIKEPLNGQDLAGTIERNDRGCR